MTSVAMLTTQHRTARSQPRWLSSLPSRALQHRVACPEVLHSQGWGPSPDGFPHEQEWLVRLQTTPLSSWHSRTCLSKLLDLPPFVASSQDLSRASEAKVFPCGPLTQYAKDTTPTAMPTANGISTSRAWGQLVLDILDINTMFCTPKVCLRDNKGRTRVLASGPADETEPEFPRILQKTDQANGGIQRKKNLDVGFG